MALRPHADENAKGLIESKKNAPDALQILSHLNEILIFGCYHIQWQAGRILEVVDSLSDVLIEVRSGSDRVVGKRDYGKR